MGSSVLFSAYLAACRTVTAVALHCCYYRRWAKIINMGDYCIQEHKLVVERERYDVRRKHMTHRYMSDRSNYSRAKEIRRGRGKKAQKFIDRDTKVLE